MRSRGQASIEFIFVMVFMFVIIAGIILPLSQSFQSSLTDVGRAGSVSSGVKQVEYTLRLLSGTNAKGKQVVGIFLPRDTSFLCDPSLDDVNISLPLALSVFNTDGSVPPSCVLQEESSPYAMICEKSVPIPSSVDITCGGSSVDSFVIETGGVGFTQSFTFQAEYTPSALPPSLPYVIDIRPGG